MKRILVTGAAGQIGSDLVPALRERYGNDNVIAAGYETPLLDDVLSAGPCTTIDVTDFGQVGRAMREHEVDTLFHMSSILSAVAEGDRRRAHEVNINGLHNVLEAAAENGLERVVAPSSIAAFGDETPKDPTPNDTIQKPTTVYGISKVYGELLGNYYSLKAGLEVRGVLWQAGYFNDADRNFHQTFDAHLDHMLARFKGGAAPPIQARAGYRALALAYAAIESYENGRRVDVSAAFYRPA